MSKRIIYSNNAPKPVGPYSQAVESGGFVFLSGQIPINPETGKVVSGDISLETEQVFKNIKAVLEAAGLNVSNIVKTTVYLTDLSQFSQVNEVYKSFFENEAPARSCVGVSSLPKGVNIEMDVIAIREV